MANQLTRDLEIMFESYVEAFEATNVASIQATKFRPGDTEMQRAGDTVYRPQQYHMELIEGLDLNNPVSGRATTLVQRQIPALFKEPQNILYSLDAREMRDPQHKQQSGKAAGMRLAAKIDQDLADMVAARTTNIFKVSAGTTNKGMDLWDAAAAAEAHLLAIGAPMGVNRCGFFNPQDYKDIAKELGFRQYAQGITATAYEKAQIPAIAGFGDCFRTDYNGYLAAGTSTAITVSGETSHTVTAMQANGAPTDNRQDTITVSAAGLAVGDAFTIAGVNAVHMIKKTDTGVAQVFRVLEVSGTTVTISPRILPVTNTDHPEAEPYANVTAAAADGAAITIVNTAPAPVNSFWCDGAVELMYGKLAFPIGQGPQVMTATTEQGATLIMSYFFDHIAGVTQCRFTTLYGTSVLLPEMTAAVIAGQS